MLTGTLTKDVPGTGEDFHVLGTVQGAEVVHIVSSDSPEPELYSQDTDEWVLVLEGRADLELDGHRARMARGDWVSIPAHTPHRVLAMKPGTQWLAVHGAR